MGVLSIRAEFDQSQQNFDVSLKLDVLCVLLTGHEYAVVSKQKPPLNPIRNEMEH